MGNGLKHQCEKGYWSCGCIGKGPNFCIGESNIPERVLLMLDRDRFYLMNDDNGYVGLHNDNPQQITVVLTDLMHSGEHFHDIPEHVLQTHSWQSAGVELPQNHLLNFIVDGHWQRPTRNICRSIVF